MRSLHQTRQPKAPCSLAFSTSTSGAPTAFLGKTNNPIFSSNCAAKGWEIGPYLAEIGKNNFFEMN